MLYHSVPGLPVCLTVRDACVNDTAAPFLSTPMHMNAHTHLRLLTLIIKQSSCATKQQSNSLIGMLFCNGRKFNIDLKVLPCDYST